MTDPYAERCIKACDGLVPEAVPDLLLACKRAEACLRYLTSVEARAVHALVLRALSKASGAPS